VKRDAHPILLNFGDISHQFQSVKQQIHLLALFDQFNKLTEELPELDGQ
jgi:hypothetical protein